jgi:hypothetical protein
LLIPPLKPLGRLLWRGLRVIRDMFAVKYFNQTYQQMFRKVVKKYPNKILFVNTTDDSTWTYSQVLLLIHSFLTKNFPRIPWQDSISRPKSPTSAKQGCKIFLVKIYQNGEKYTK